MLNKITKVRFANNHSRGVNFYQNSYYYDKDYFITETDSVILQKALNVITNSTLIKPGSKDIIYASKASEIPRFKLKEFIKDNKLKKTSRHKMASVIIINKGYFYELIKCLKYGEHTFVNMDYVEQNGSQWFDNLKKVTIINNFKNYKDKDNFVLVESEPDNLNDLFKKIPTSRILYTSNTHTTKGTSLTTYRETKLFELVNLIADNVSDIIKGDKRIIFDEDLFVELNKEGIELDDDYLKVLRDMLFSKDKSNVKLGFEMMSNLVINQHTLLSISFLLNELIHTTGFRPSYYTSNNSNLKSLLKVLKTKGIHWEGDWKKFGTGLRLNFKDGKEGEIVKKFLLDNINREFKLNNSAAESLVDIVFATEVPELTLA